jgi:hypothetical protein
MAALTYQFTNAVQAWALVVRTNASIAGTRPLYATIVSSSSRRTNTFSRVSAANCFFVTGSSSLDGQREEEFSSFIRDQAMSALWDPRLARPNLSIRFFISSK